MIGLARQISTSVSIDGGMTDDGEQFFQPPNVSGWPGYQDWLTTSTYPLRTVAQAQALVSGYASAQGLQTFLPAVPSVCNSDVTVLATQIGQLLLPRPLSSARTNYVPGKRLPEAPMKTPGSIWVNADPEEAAVNTQKLLQVIICAAGFSIMLNVDRRGQ